MKDDYISNIIQRITDIRYFLDEDLFSITDKVTETYTQNDINLEKVIKEMSTLASEIVELVFQSKADKQNLTEGDIIAINKIGLLATKLGASESELYKVKKQLSIVKEETMRLSTMGMDFSQKLIELQDHSRSIITEFRQAGREVPGSDLQKLMNVDENNTN